MDFFKNLKKLISGHQVSNIYSQFKLPSSIPAEVTAWTDRQTNKQTNIATTEQKLKKPIYIKPIYKRREFLIYIF